MSGISIPCAACTALGLSIDLEIRFTTVSKEVTPSLSFEIPSLPCTEFSLSIDFVTVEPLSIVGLAISDMEFQMEFEQHISMSVSTSFGNNGNPSVTWTLTGPVTTCCSSSGYWKIEFYFPSEPSAPTLFGWETANLELDLPLSEQIAASLDLEFSSVSPHWSLTVGFGVVY